MTHTSAIDRARESSRFLRACLIFSAAAHLATLAALVACGIVTDIRIAIPLTRLDPTMDVFYSGPVQPGKESEGRDVVKDIKESVPKRLEEANKLSLKEKSAKFDAKLKELQKVRGSSIDEIGLLFGSDKRAYAPVVPPPPGPFHADSAIPYTMKETKDGGYVQTLVDKDGRTLQVVIRPDEVTEQDRETYKLFKKIESNPIIRKLYIMALKVLPEEKGDEDE